MIGLEGEAEVYVLDMGEPVKIIDLARRMVELSGLKLKMKIHQKATLPLNSLALRPGEKLYEELLIGNSPQTTEHPRILKANEKFLPWSELRPMISTLLIAAVNGDVIMIRSMLQKLVPEYRPDEKVVDWLYREQIAQADESWNIEMILVHSYLICNLSSNKQPAVFQE